MRARTSAGISATAVDSTPRRKGGARVTQARARLELLSRAGWDRHTPNLLRAIAHHPQLLESFLGFAAALATRGELPRRVSELLALRAAWNCRSEFEWGHHALYARAAGLSDAEIAAI